MIIQLKKLFNHALLHFFSLFPIDNSMIVLESESDLSDNAFAFFDYLQNNTESNRYKYVWLVENPTMLKTKSNYSIDLICKNGLQDCIRRMKVLATCKYYIYDHNNLYKGKRKRKKQIIVNLYHGCGIKYTPSLKVKDDIDYLITTSKFFNNEFSRIFNIGIDRIYSLGYPRTDYFYKAINQEQAFEKKQLSKYDKILFWMPTFRRSSNKELDEDYFASETGLPLLTSNEDLKELDKFLSSRNCLCIFKIHHLQADLNSFKYVYSNIQILTDDDIRNKGMQLYQYLVLTDALITDYSSVATDYMLLDRPILYTIDDYNDFNGSRGFWINNAIDYLPGNKATNKESFYESLNKIIDGMDEYYGERSRINSIFNEYKDGNHCKRIMQLIGIE